MALFDKDKREARQKEKSVRKEEQATMKRAEAMASAINTKPTTEGYSFNTIENEAKVKEANAPGLTVVTGAEPLTFNEQKTVSYTPEQVAARPALQQILATSDQDNIAANAIAKEGYSKAKTQEEIDQVSQDFEAAKDLEKQEKAKLQTQLYTGPANAIVNATSTYLQNIGNQPGAPSYVGEEATKEKIGEDVAKTYSDINNQIPNAVLEKLGVQDYYPQAGRDVAVGTFTGSRIGSQTIYSGAGALLPMGLYDARKRALAAAAKEKQALVDKYSSIIETAPQYQEPFNQANAEWFNQMWDKHKGDANSFLKDPEVRKEHARRLGLAKELSHYSKWADDLLLDDKEDKKYITNEMRKNAIDIKSALINNTEDVVSGKLDLGKLFAKAKVYQNMIPQLDNVLNRVLDSSKLGQSPINLRTGGEYDSDKFKNEANQFIQKANTGNINYNDFITGFKKYFTGNYEQIIDGMIQSGKYSEEQKKAAMNYFAGQLQSQVVLDHKILDSKALGWAELAQKNRQWQAEFEQKKAEGKGYWDVVNESMNFVDDRSGKPITQLIEGWKNQGLSASQIQQRMLETARNNGIRNAYINPYTKAVTISMRPSDKEAESLQPANTSESSFFIKERTWSNKSKKWVYNDKPITYNDFLNIKDFKTKDGQAKYLFPNNQKISAEIVKEYRDASRENRLFLRANKIEASYGLMNDKTKNIETLSPSNINQFSSNKAVNFKRTVGVPYAKIPIYDENGKPKMDPTTNQPVYQYKALPGTMFFNNQISTDAGRKPLNAIHGDKYKANGFGLEYETVGEGNYSGGSSSGEE